MRDNESLDENAGSQKRDDAKRSYNYPLVIRIGGVAIAIVFLVLSILTISGFMRESNYLSIFTVSLPLSLVAIAALINLRRFNVTIGHDFIRVTEFSCKQLPLASIERLKYDIAGLKLLGHGKVIAIPRYLSGKDDLFRTLATKLKNRDDLQFEGDEDWFRRYFGGK